MGRSTWEVADNEMGKTNLPQEMGCPRWEVARHEMGKQIYHRRWDVQDGKWQVRRREDIFAIGDGTFNMPRVRLIEKIQ